MKKKLKRPYGFADRITAENVLKMPFDLVEVQLAATVLALLDYSHSMRCRNCFYYDEKLDGKSGKCVGCKEEYEEFVFKKMEEENEIRN